MKRYVASSMQDFKNALLDSILDIAAMCPGVPSKYLDSVKVSVNTWGNAEDVTVFVEKTEGPLLWTLVINIKDGNVSRKTNSFSGLEATTLEQLHELEFDVTLLRYLVTTNDETWVDAVDRNIKYLNM